MSTHMSSLTSTIGDTRNSSSLRFVSTRKVEQQSMLSSLCFISAM
ncbi:hypothetical protein T4E_2874 [Trichinella pseudospiralis]|uniref:Uncharacterized protein n=1 Tax=Trichinella pseudospiralis TaxID=6337 RepID=A0A0V0X1I8_TRIPS|nr:hypothetical protein T4E_2874 [Trichinella pseudospiralis]